MRRAVLAVGLSGAIRATLASPVLMGPIGLGIGALPRHTAGAVTTLAAIMLILPALSGVWPGPERSAVT